MFIAIFAVDFLHPILGDLGLHDHTTIGVWPFVFLSRGVGLLTTAAAISR